MARTVKLSKTSDSKIDKLCKNLGIEEEIHNELKETILKDVRYIKECSEKSIVDFYLESFTEMYSANGSSAFEWDVLKERTRQKLAQKYVPKKSFDNNIDIYFNDVKREYILHPMNESTELEFIPENKEIFIKNNLKLVINCAKRYRNLGIPFEDLIQIGNCGLLKAWEKFDTSRANLQEDIIRSVREYHSEEFSRLDAEDIIKQNFKYSKTLDTTLNKLPEEGFTSKEDFVGWCKDNIKKASFSSIGFSWIRAMIMLELNSSAKIIRIPKSAQNDKTACTIISLDSINPYTEDNYYDNQISDIANEEFIIEDENMEQMERQNLFKELVEKVLLNLNGMDRRIVKRRFGIDVPYQLSIQEIAESEGISVSKVKSSLANSMQVIARNIPEKDKEMLREMLN